MYVGRWLVLITLLAPAFAFADDFADFRIPDHHIRLWDVRLSGSADRNKFADSASQRWSYDASGSTGSSALWLRDSEDHRASLSLDLRLDGTRQSQKAEDGLGESRTSGRFVREFSRLFVSDRRYLGSSRVAIEGSVLGSAATDQAWSRIEADGPPSNILISHQRDSDNRNDYFYVVNGDLAVGVGRVRDATAVYDALALEERLRERGVLKQPLAPLVRQRIASLLYVRNDLATVLDRPGKTLWAELVQVLSDSGSLERDVDPVTVIRALEPYARSTALMGYPPQSPLLRQRGGFFGLAVEASHNHSIGRQSRTISSWISQGDSVVLSSSTSLSTRFSTDQDLILFGPRGEYHRPLGPRHQLDASGALLFWSKDAAHRFRLVSAVSWGWILGDRWIATVSANEARDIVSPEVALARRTDWILVYEGKISWYVEDRLRLDAGLQGSQEHWGDGMYEQLNQIFFGLSYKLAGRLDAPGLMQPIRVP